MIVKVLTLIRCKTKIVLSVARESVACITDTTRSLGEETGRGTLLSHLNHLIPKSCSCSLVWKSLHHAYYKYFIIRIAIMKLYIFSFAKQRKFVYIYIFSCTQWLCLYYFLAKMITLPLRAAFNLDSAILLETEGLLVN